jgi:hypothetical protein
MASVERFGNIRRGELDYHPLSALGGIALVLQAKEWIQAEDFLLLEGGWNKDFCELVDFEEELDKLSGQGRRVDQGRLGELLTV